MLRKLYALAASIAVAGGLLTGVVAAAPGASAASAGELANTGSGLCLGIQGSATFSGAKAEQGTCSGTPTQTWHFRSEVFFISGGASLFAVQFANGVGECLGVAGSSHSSGAQVVQGTCADVSTCPTPGSSVPVCTQLWFPVSTATGDAYQGDPGSGHYGFANIGSLLCLGVQGSSHVSGALVIQGFCGNPLPTLTQQWGGSWL